MYGPFSSSVEENQPADAAVMFDFFVDIDEEILELYETNTQRFVDAQQAG